MLNKSFYSAKKIYDQIAKQCLRASFEKRETDCFKIYENISRKCYNLLMLVKETSLKEKSKEDEDVKKISESIFGAYFSYNNIDEDYQRDVRSRAMLLQWRDDIDAYGSLKAFSDKIDKKREYCIEDIISILKEVNVLLQADEDTLIEIVQLLDNAFSDK